jgi:hypothetical protein
MANDYDWEEVKVAQGTFIGWANKPGQKMTARTLAYAEAGGHDYNGEPCPQVTAELVEPFDNYRDKGTTKETLEAGQIVEITCGLANLKRTVRGAALEPGNMFLLEFTDLVPTDKDPVKIFTMKVARTKPTAGVSADSVI